MFSSFCFNGGSTLRYLLVLFSWPTFLELFQVEPACPVETLRVVVVRACYACTGLWLLPSITVQSIVLLWLLSPSVCRITVIDGVKMAKLVIKLFTFCYMKYCVSFWLTETVFCTDICWWLHQHQWSQRAVRYKTLTCFFAVCEMVGPREQRYR